MAGRPGPSLSGGDCELGALPPLGSFLKMPVVVDEEVVAHDTIVFAAGTQTESVRMRTQDLLRLEQVTVAPISMRPDL